MAQGLLGCAAIEVGIGALAVELHRLGLVSNGSAGIAQGELHIAAITPGRRIARGHLQHLVPEGQSLIKAPLPAGAEGLIKQLGQQQLQAQQQGKQRRNHGWLLVMRPH